jgi:predicted DsbA family dithiol-disulfide isomerase
VEALFRAYFTEGRDISNRQTLIDVVAEVGLEKQRAEAVLNGDEGMEAIKEAEGLSLRHQVGGVPFFIINGKITLSGAQPPEAFLEAFGQAVGGEK